MIRRVVAMSHHRGSTRWRITKCLPPFRARLAFPRTDNFVGDPTAVKITGLGPNALVIDEALNATGIERKIGCDRVVRSLRRRIAPSHCLTCRRGGFEAPVLRHAFPFTDRCTGKWLELLDAHVSRRDVECRRTRGFQNAKRFGRISNDLIAESNNDPPLIGDQLRWSRIIPYGFLTGCWLMRKRRPLAPCIFPHSFRFLVC